MKKSPIKYFGGKNGFANKIIEFFPNNYQNLNYIEPFCGSAAMLFHKLRSPVEIINDLDQNVYSLFKVLIEKKLFEEFRDLCQLSNFSEQLLKEFTKDLRKDTLSIAERAYKFFYCNRVAYNGSGGISASSVIRRGMSKSVSDFLSAIDGLEDTHKRLSGVIVQNRNAFDLIQKWDKQDTFQYLDPPYALETRSSGGYKHDMTDADQDNLLNILLNIKNSKILLSGYKCERYEILESSGWKRIDMTIKTQNTNRAGKSKIESLWFNY